MVKLLLKFQLTFNSLYGIPPNEVFKVKIYNFQFPLWDTEAVKELKKIAEELNFQFPLWDTIEKLQNTKNLITFQFPLWDTETFFAKQTSDLLNFQFPLWDT